MKSKRSSLMCIALACILLFLGMCSQIKRADSVLASFQQIASEADYVLTDSQQTVFGADTIDKAEIDAFYIGNCTNKLIDGLRDTFQSIRRGQGRTTLRNQAEFLCIQEILQMFLSFYVVIAAVCYQIQGSEIKILNYIHNQDGKK